MDKGSLIYFIGQIVALDSAVVKIQILFSSRGGFLLMQCITTWKQPDLLTMKIGSQLTCCQS